jgi:hypothetical protein
MLRLLSKKMYQQLDEELQAILSNEPNPLKRMTATVSKVRSALQNLKEYLSKHPFATDTEEIHFFKNIKPKFYAKQIYHIELYKIEDAKPYGTVETIREYYEEELNIIRRFFRQNQFLYEYYRNEMVELDNLYFIRTATIQNILLPEVPEVHPEFSTSCDYLFSKFIAYELLQTYLVKAINRIDPTNTTLPDAKEEQLQLKWTGEQVNLIELIYGIYYTGQLNHGNVEVKDIIEVMETIFQVKLKSPYHTFGNIRRRKSISPTAYLDKMREAILQRIEEDLEYKPNRGIALRNKPE